MRMRMWMAGSTNQPTNQLIFQGGGSEDASEDASQECTGCACPSSVHEHLLHGNHEALMSTWSTTLTRHSRGHNEQMLHGNHKALMTSTRPSNPRPPAERDPREIRGRSADLPPPTAAYNLAATPYASPSWPSPPPHRQQRQGRRTELGTHEPRRTDRRWRRCC